MTRVSPKRRLLHRMVGMAGERGGLWGCPAGRDTPVELGFPAVDPVGCTILLLEGLGVVARRQRGRVSGVGRGGASGAGVRGGAVAPAGCDVRGDAGGLADAA